MKEKETPIIYADLSTQENRDYWRFVWESMVTEARLLPSWAGQERIAEAHRKAEICRLKLGYLDTLPPPADKDLPHE